MFEKLLANLPANPGLSHHLAFYSRRMREEAGLRRIGLIFIVMTFFVQFFAVLAPPVATSAYSTNDLINGPVTSKAQIVSACTNNDKSYKDVMRTFGIACSDLAGADVISLKANAQDGNLYSLGWLPQGAHNDNTGKATNEAPLNVLNYNKSVYARLLHSWDKKGTVSTYTALSFMAHGHRYYVLYGCGNLVGIGVPVPLPVCPFNPNILKEDNDCKEKCKYDSSISADNPKCFKPCQYDKSIPADSPKCFKPCQYNPAIPAGDAKCVPKCKYDSSILSTDARCFAHCPLAGLTNLPQNSPQCKAKCPYDANITADNPACFQKCQYNPAIPATSPDCATKCQYNPAILSTDPNCQTPCQYNSTILVSSPDCFPPCQYNNAISANSPDCFPPCQYNNTIAANDAACKPCESSLSSEDTVACVSIHKTASNVTAGVTNADNTTAKAGDVINYTLYAENKGKADVKEFVFLENMSDVLDYADITDLHGGTFDKDTKTVTWPTEKIAAGATASHQITVKIKDPIPQTPAGTTDPQHFDLIMTNVYGNAVNIKLPPTPTQTVQQTAANLPNTGPGTSLLIAGTIVILAGYFYSRARLLQEESTVAVQEAANA